VQQTCCCGTCPEFLILRTINPFEMVGKTNCGFSIASFLFASFCQGTSCPILFGFSSVPSPRRAFWYVSVPCAFGADRHLWIYDRTAVFVRGLLQGRRCTRRPGFRMGTLTRIQFRTSIRVSEGFNDSNCNSTFNTSNACLSQPAAPNKMTTTTAHPFVHSDPYARANTPKCALTTSVPREVLIDVNLASGSTPSIEAFKPLSPLPWLGWTRLSRSQLTMALTPMPMQIPIRSAHALDPRRGSGRRGAQGCGRELECGLQETIDYDVGGSEGNSIVVVKSG
jgi:hypothetical protein